MADHNQAGDIAVDIDRQLRLFRGRDGRAGRHVRSAQSVSGAPIRIVPEFRSIN